MLSKIFDLVRVRRKLVMGKGATIVSTSAAGVETVVDMTELATLGGVTASAAELNIMDGCTATAAEINMAADSSANVETVAATNVIDAAESGKTFFLNHATEFVSTLPAVAAGLRFTFIVSGAPSGASYTIVTASSANVILGHVLTSQDAGGSADSETSGGDTITFVDSKAVVGDRVDVICDGTNWFAQCSSKVFDAITITTAS
jgi:hypothetical protein